MKYITFADITERYGLSRVTIIKRCRDYNIKITRIRSGKTGGPQKAINIIDIDRLRVRAGYGKRVEKIRPKIKNNLIMGLYHRIQNDYYHSGTVAR